MTSMTLPGWRTMTVGMLLDAFEALPADAPVQYRGAGLDGRIPYGPWQWAGNSRHIGLGHAQMTPDGLEWATVDIIRDFLQSELDYPVDYFTGARTNIDRDTPVWVDQPKSHELAGGITGLRLIEWGVVMDVVAGAGRDATED